MPKKTFQVSVIDILLFVNESLIKVLIFYRILLLCKKKKFSRYANFVQDNSLGGWYLIHVTSDV